MNKNRLISNILYIAVIALVFSWTMGLFSGGNNSISYAQVVELFEQEQVEKFVVRGGTITLELKTPLDGKVKVATNLSDEESFRREMMPLITEQSEKGIIKDYDFVAARATTPFDYVLPALIVGLLLLFVWMFLTSRAANNANSLNNFGKARTNLGTSSKPTTFGDVAGADEEKQELQEVVEFLKDPEKYTSIGAKIPHGILLVGPPGTGKTLLARAVAGEAGVQFLSISGSDFVEMYVGVGASRVRDMFDQAKKIAPAIIFIDEIDAVGRKRGSGLGGGHDEKEQTLNQLLVEMDGFNKNEGVIVMAATNRPDILDPALLRPGRFDRQIYVGKPDAKGREEILKVHARNKKLDGSVNLKTVAMSTSGFTGADLENLLNEAAIQAVRHGRPVLTMEDMNEAMMKVLAGPEKRSRLRLKKDQWLTAVHEAGHAVTMYFLPTQDPVSHITIIPRGQALGITWSFPQEESTHWTRNEMYEEIVGLLGGRVAEALNLHDISTGASNDIDRASNLARNMVARFGMNDKLGTVSYLNDGEVFIGRDFEKTKSYSEQVAATIDEQVKLLVDQAYHQCAQILTEHSDKLNEVAKFLMEHENMTGAQFKACMEGRQIDEASAVSMFESNMPEEPKEETEE